MQTLTISDCSHIGSHDFVAYALDIAAGSHENKWLFSMTASQASML